MNRRVEETLDRSIYQDSLIRKVEDTIDTNHMLESGDAVLIGVSGGPDSMCLLDVFLKIAPVRGYRIEVAHVNHSLRGMHSMGDQDFTAGYCRQNDIIFHTSTIDVISFAKENTMGIEEAARHLRYRFFSECVSSRAMKVAVAHHQQDQSETILMNLIRGCGLDGLTGMAYCTGEIIRPLLDCTKEEIEGYLDFHKIPYRTDLSNMESCADRNRVRLSLIPFISSQFRRDVYSSVRKTGILCRRDSDYLDEEACRAFSEIYFDNAIHCDQLKFLKPAILSRVIRNFYETAKGNKQNLSFAQTEAVIHIINKEKEGSMASLSDGYSAAIFDQRLHIMRTADLDGILESKEKEKREKESIRIPLSIPGEKLEEDINLSISTKFVENSCEVVYNAQTWCFPYERVTEAVWRYRRTGDWIRPNPKSGTKTVRKFLTDNKIPSEAKSNLVVLADGAQILWIPGIGGSRTEMDGTAGIIKINVHSSVKI